MEAAGRRWGLHGAWSLAIAGLLTAALLTACDGSVEEVDASIDTGGGGECATDPDCDDALFCNGVERCDANVCLAGTAPCATCDETTDACDCANADADADGHESTGCGGDDCDDDDDRRSPGLPEVCDTAALDEDCDPTTFGDRDSDADGFVDARCCNDEGGVSRCGDDCDDIRRGANPLSTEACDLVDNDCDENVDEGVDQPGFFDEDHDLHGDGARATRACAGAPGFSPVGDDCDDTDPLVHGRQSEVCNGLDDDCDGAMDEGAGASAWYPDFDADGFGDPDGTPMMSCVPVAEHRLLATDCDDDDPVRNPGMDELCNALDDDCNGRADAIVAPGDLEDDDLDGYPDAACTTGPRADCDDRDPTVHPGAPEILDGTDNDCDGTTDGSCEMASWYPDADSDGFGEEGAAPARSCETLPGHAARDGDCDETDPDRNPGERDICNGIDDDCDGTVDGDAARYCVVPHSLPLCSAGSCAIGLCERNFDDCDPARAGCETDTRTSALHCATCGNVCTFGAQSLPACVASVCTLTCASGYGNCDGSPTNGCEIDTRFDEGNCGRCGQICGARDNAFGRCNDGVCGIECVAGFGDCDGMLGNGCEVDLRLDEGHCGGCGMRCPITGDVCARASCLAPAFPSDGSDGDFMPTVDTVLATGRHDFVDVVIPAGVTVTVATDGVLDLRATGEIVIAGTLDLSGGRGGTGGLNVGGTGQAPGQGGFTGTSADGAAGMSGVCWPAATGGSGGPGSDAQSAGCGLGGLFGGGGGGGRASFGYGAGGGGGGYAGGGGGGSAVGSGFCCGNAGGAGGSVGGAGTGGAAGPIAGAGGGAEAGLRTTMWLPYAGGDGALDLSGGGGSIGAAAAMDLPLANMTFYAGSGGGGGGQCNDGGVACSGGSGGGGGGGALRLSSLVAIRITGIVLVEGGRGGTGGTGGSGGGGSGGVLYLAAPEVQVVAGRLSAAGGAGGVGITGRNGGAGGLGRIRISTIPELCAITGSVNPPLATGCMPTPGAGMPGFTYVGVYPN